MTVGPTFGCDEDASDIGAPLVARRQGTCPQQFLDHKVHRRRFTQLPGVSRAAAPPQEIRKTTPYPERVLQVVRIRIRYATPAGLVRPVPCTWGGAAARVTPGY